MPYIGKSPLHGNFNELTDVSGSFDGSETEFALTENLTSTAITPVMPAALIISLNGVVQEPTTDYTVTGTNITFTTAPAATDSFFGIAMGKQLDVGTPSDSTVTTAKLASTVFTGATDIGAAIVDADLFLLDDGAGGTIRKTVASRIKTYVEASAMAVTGNITATGEATFGPGGTGTDVVNIIADGGSGAAGGSTFEVRSNGTFRGGLGNKAALLGSGTSTDLELRAASSIPITFAPNNTNALTLDTSGNATFAGNLTFGTSGKGVHLGVTSATASNLLDDYEEGTWTPAFTSTSATFGYTTQGGNYTKVGRMCLLTFRLELNGSAPGGTTSNSLFISGLPFAIATLADTYHGGSIGHYFSINLSTTGVLAYQLSSGASTVELKVVGDNLGETAVLASHLVGASEIRGQILYHTA